MFKTKIAIGLTVVFATASMSPGQTVQQDAPGERDPIRIAPGQGVTIDGGDEFMLNLLNLLQVRWEFAALDTSPDVNTFDVRRARTYLSGHVFSESVEYLMSMEWTEPDSASPQPIKDALVLWKVVPTVHDGWTGIQVGQMRTYYGLEATAWEGGLEYPERAIASRTFAGRRNRGALLRGEYFREKLFWNAGVINGDVASATGPSIQEATGGEEASNADNALGFVATAGVDLLGAMGQARYEEGDLLHGATRLTMRAGFAWSQNVASPAAGGPFDVDALNWTAATAIKTDGHYLAGEYFYRQDIPDVGVRESDYGWQFQYSYTTEPASTQYGIGARVSKIVLEDGATWLDSTPLTGAGDVGELGGVFNIYFHEHRLKTQISYGYLVTDPDAGSAVRDQIVRVQLQLVF